MPDYTRWPSQTLPIKGFRFHKCWWSFGHIYHHFVGFQFMTLVIAFVVKICPSQVYCRSVSTVRNGPYVVKFCSNPRKKWIENRWSNVESDTCIRNPYAICGAKVRLWWKFLQPCEVPSDLPNPTCDLHGLVVTSLLCGDMASPSTFSATYHLFCTHGNFCRPSMLPVGPTNTLLPTTGGSIRNSLIPLKLWWGGIIFQSLKKFFDIARGKRNGLDQNGNPIFGFLRAMSVLPPFLARQYFVRIGFKTSKALTPRVKRILKHSFILLTPFLQ